MDKFMKHNNRQHTNAGDISVQNTSVCRTRGETQMQGTMRQAIVQKPNSFPLHKLAISKAAILKMLLAFLCMTPMMAANGSATSSTSKAATIQYKGGGNYSLVERTDLRRYDNGRYTGLVSREVRSFITSTSPDSLASRSYTAAMPNGAGGSGAKAAPALQTLSEDSFYDGNFYIKEETMKNRRKAANSINMSIPSSFRITQSGELVMIEDNGYPSFRSFPAFSSSAVHIGDKWRSDAVRAVDPMSDGVITHIPLHVEYTYLGNDVWNGEDVFVLSAKWATRYGGINGGGKAGGYVDAGGDPSLLRAEGSHDATMYVSCRTGAALVVRDKVDETFIYDKGNAVSFKGSISLFTEYPPAVDRKSLIPALQKSGIASAAEVAALSKGDGGKGGKDKGSNGKDGAEGGRNAKGKSGNNPVDNSTGGGRDGNKSDGIKVGPSPSDATGKADGGGGRKDREAVPPSPIDDSTGPLSATAEVASAAIVSSDGGGNIKVEDTSSGVRLTIQDLRFLPDSAQLLPEERGRVAAIASVLREVPKSMFLVEGHTASTGNPRGEQNLSEERARTIAQALASYGIDEGRFILKGSGGRKPIADNSTAQGKAQNRRVEITILE